MAQLRQDYDKFQATGTVVLVVGPEGRDDFQKYWQEHDLPVTGLPLEEAIFFLVTNVLIGFGVTLALAEESRIRLERWLPTSVVRKSQEFTP